MKFCISVLAFLSILLFSDALLCHGSASMVYSGEMTRVENGRKGQKERKERDDKHGHKFAAGLVNRIAGCQMPLSRLRMEYRMHEQ